MSHFTQVKTALREKRFLQAALKNMGFTVVEEPQGVEVRGYMGNKLDGEFKILTSTHYDIGFVKNENGDYEVIGDWELLPHVSEIEQESFVTQLKREYAKESITTLAREQGYEVEMQENPETHEIEMVVSQW